MTEFIPPPPGMLTGQIDLPDHKMSLGLMHREGEGIRVFIWDGDTWRHLTCDSAVGYADYLDGEAYAAMLKPVSDALRSLAARAGEIEATAMFTRAAQCVGGPVSIQELMGMQVEGRA
jgi:hypothetical protein